MDFRRPMLVPRRHAVGGHMQVVPIYNTSSEVVCLIEVLPDVPSLSVHVGILCLCRRALSSRGAFHWCMPDRYGIAEP